MIERTQGAEERSHLLQNMAAGPCPTASALGASCVSGHTGRRAGRRAAQESDLGGHERRERVDSRVQRTRITASRDMGRGRQISRGRGDDKSIAYSSVSLLLHDVSLLTSYQLADACLAKLTGCMGVGWWLLAARRRPEPRRDEERARPSRRCAPSRSMSAITGCPVQARARPSPISGNPPPPPSRGAPP